MPRRAPRYGFIADQVILTHGAWRSTSTGTMVNISEGGMCVLLPGTDLTLPDAPAVGGKVDVSFRPILLHKSPIPVAQWTIGQAEVRWIEKLPSDGAAALGLAFTTGTGMPAAVRDWVSCMSEPQASNMSFTRSRRIVRGLNILGVGAAVWALIFGTPGTASWNFMMWFLLVTIGLLALEESGLLERLLAFPSKRTSP
jgi:hypothetical protein